MQAESHGFPEDLVGILQQQVSVVLGDSLHQVSQGVHVVDAGSLTVDIVDEPIVLFWRVQEADEQEPHINNHTLLSMNLSRFQWVSVWSKLYDSLKFFVKKAPEG